MDKNRRKTGGRPKGGLNKATVAKLLDAQVAEKVEAIIGKVPEKTSTALQAMTRTARGKDELASLILVVKGHVATFQAAVLAMGNPGAIPTKENPSPYNWALFDRYVKLLELYQKVSDSAADFQDPRLKAQLFVPAAPEMPATIIDDDRKVVRFGDSVRASRLYQQVMKAPRQKALPPPAKRSA